MSGVKSITAMLFQLETIGESDFRRKINKMVAPGFKLKPRIEGMI